MADSILLLPASVVNIDQVNVLSAVPPMLESEEAARRLGVKRSTLYAYVSRGLLASHPSEDRRRRLFDGEDVEALARRSWGSRRVESRLATVTTGITQLRDDGPTYRGRPVAELARSLAFEEVADLLWGTAPGPWVPAHIGPPPALSASALLQWAVVVAGATEPLPSDLRAETVARSARRLIATMVDVLPSENPTTTAGPDAPEGSASIAQALAQRLVVRPTPDVVTALNMALVLLADHELATSTVAVRVAASTRCALSDALAAGLATMAGSLHGGASQLAHAMLVAAERDGVDRALDDTLRWQKVLPGFGHSVYKHGDPRAAVLMDCFDQLASEHQRRLVGSLVALAADYNIPAPNVDLGLAALSWATGMAADAGRTIFAVARGAGWTAHYLEELDERPLRFGPGPSTPRTVDQTSRAGASRPGSTSPRWGADTR